MTKKPNSEPFKQVLYAHRGLFDNETDAPENSLRAIKKAVDAGYGIEMDLHLTKDGQVVVFHDFSLKRMCNEQGNVEDYTYEELQNFRLKDSDQTIPLFTDVLKVVDGKVPLIIEYKGESSDLSLMPVADAILREYKGLYCIESFNPLMVKWYKDNNPTIMRGQLSDDYLKEGQYVGMLYFAMGNLLLNFLAKPDFVAYNKKHPLKLSRRICRGLYKNVAAAWTIKSQEELDEARKYFDIFIFDSFIPEGGPKAH